MRSLLPLLLLGLLLPAGACRGRSASPAPGSKELLLELGASLRAEVDRDYPNCGLSSSVRFDGTAYHGRAGGTIGPEAIELTFARAGQAWSCIDAESTGPGEGPPCQAVRAACR
jgi:hypothetical protein